MGKMGKVEKLFVNSPRHSKQVSRHAERLLKQVNFEAGQAYLDVGCGNGAAPIYLAQTYGLDVTGVDVDPDQIRAAEAKCIGMDNTRFLGVDGTQLPFEDTEFDIVATNKVMHHIPNWEISFAEMVRVLKPKGFLIYADLVAPGWVATVGELIIKKYVGFPTVNRLERLIEAHQLTSIYLSKSPLHYEGVFQKPAIKS